MPDTQSIHEFLRQANVPYTLIAHRPAHTAQTEAAAAHVPARDWAKVVICVVDGVPVHAVVPANAIVDLERLLELTGGNAVRLATEEELGQLFPDCEPGAMPPFGALYGHEVFVDVSLAMESSIGFNAGTCTMAIAMRWAHFARTVRPTVGSFADPPLDRVAAFRLSFRE